MSHKRTIATGEYYHIYNRAIYKQQVFLDRYDYARFLFGTIYFQSPTNFSQIGRMARGFNDNGFAVSDADFSNVLAGRHIELIAFCVMPNHYHLLVRQLVERGIERYMHRVTLAYARYRNLRYQSSGHVFQGPYQSVLVENNEQLMHLSAYIHRNPRELKAWKGSEKNYPWSSYQDYVHENRWGGLLAQEIVLDQFAGTPESNYADFVRTSTAKELPEN